ncbi:MAG: transcriptional regulator [Gammaproteobacteria bacterium]|nr:transcriptional regulator [Gammaproteobacteria bacterium]MCY4210137.1 transcriptional regulator [Gammaproteobacteria bacterium]
MKVETEIKKWGNSLALRVTGVMATLPEFKAGTRVVVDVTDEGLVVKPATRKKDSIHFPYTEDELLADLTPETVHADELAKVTAYELGN